MRLGILASHPIQYQAPWFRALAKAVDLQVFFAHRQSAAEQGAAGFGVSFDWDVDLLAGYTHRFLKNESRRPGVSHFSGCDTPEIRDIIRDSYFDAFVVTGWYLKSYWQAVRACRRSKTPLLVRGDSQLATKSSLFKRIAKALTYRFLLGQFDGFLAVGLRNREYLTHYGVPAEKMFSAPHFVDNDWFAARALEARGERAVMRKAWGADEASLVVLFVGKFIPVKRPADIVRALANLSEAGIKYIGVYVGAGELESSLRAEAKALQVKAHFEGFRNQTELPRYYASADVLVLASESETWGLVVNEGMACGLPAIVSEAVGCAPDLVEEGKTGFTFPVADCEQLARRLESLAESKNRGHDFASATAAKVNAYSVEAAVSGTLQAVENLTASRHG